jgi:lipopolysaccharide/colanic/teichoic acid biosynthesis glycosyltransferase
MIELESAETARERATLDAKCSFKYLIDRLLAIACLPLLFSFMFLGGILMVFEGIRNPRSRGPLFYSEERWSQGRPFRIYKFRTTYVGTGALGELTWAGNLLKKWYLDELPQVLNILAGDMTLVGPRPNTPENARREIVVEGMRSKLLLRAGLTGLVQVYKREARDRSIYADLERQYLEEIMRRSPLGVVLYDLELLAKTVPMMLRGEGL